MKNVNELARLFWLEMRSGQCSNRVSPVNPVQPLLAGQATQFFFTQTKRIYRRFLTAGLLDEGD